MDNTYELFRKIIETKGITPYKVAKDTGLTTVLFTDWKKGKSKPKYDKLKIIANYLGVSPDYLMGIDNKQQEILDILDDATMTNLSQSANQLEEKETSKNELFTDIEKMIIKIFRNANEKQKLKIIQQILNIMDQEN